MRRKGSRSPCWGGEERSPASGCDFRAPAKTLQPAKTWNWLGRHGTGLGKGMGDSTCLTKWEMKYESIWIYRSDQMGNEV